MYEVCKALTPLPYDGTVVWYFFLQVEVGHAVFLSHDVEGADILYTIDGSTPEHNGDTTKVYSHFCQRFNYQPWALVTPKLF